MNPSTPITVKIEPFTFHHGNKTVDRFKITVENGRIISFPTHEEALAFVTAHGYLLEG